MRDERKSAAGPAATVALLLLAAAAVLYVPSVGPAWWCAKNEYLSWPVYRAIYFPVLWCYEHSPGFATLLERYIDFWRE